MQYPPATPLERSITTTPERGEAGSGIFEAKKLSTDPERNEEGRFEPLARRMDQKGRNAASVASSVLAKNLERRVKTGFIRA